MNQRIGFPMTMVQRHVSLPHHQKNAEKHNKHRTQGNASGDDDLQKALSIFFRQQALPLVLCLIVETGV